VSSGNLRFITRIRVRSTFQRAWIWELVLADGHVVQQSEPFKDRSLCEAEAKQQGLPVQGLARPRSA